jgi:Circadian oscillating protein COP23
MISWVSNLGGRDPQQRCLEITERFQNFSDNGMLRFLRTSTVNGLPVLCVARFRGGSCDRSSVLITLQAGQDPQLVRQQLIDIASRASSGPIRLRSNEVIFYEDGEPYVNVDKLLEAAPVDSESSP